MLLLSSVAARRARLAGAAPRESLAAESHYLATTVAELMPDEPEARGLLALMLLTESRRPARTAADGSLVRLGDQDRARWDRALIDEGHALAEVGGLRRPFLPGGAGADHDQVEGVIGHGV